MRIPITLPLLTASALAAAFSAPAGGRDVTSVFSGGASALSGDTITVERIPVIFAADRRTLRLLGIAAPPPGTLCRAAGGAEWACGDASKDALTGRLAGEVIVCRVYPPDEAAEGKETRRDSAAPDPEPADAECAAQNRNLNLWMLETGHAAQRPGFRGRSPAYDEAEESARRIAAGVWGAELRAEPDGGPDAASGAESEL